MVGIYLSGTGNTKHCLEKLLLMLDSSAELVPIENNKDAVQKIKTNDIIYLAYPTQFSNIPFMVRDFIQENKEIWQGKKVFCMTTMGLFSGDGTGCAARLLKKFGAIIIGGLQVKMPDAVCDSKMLKKPFEENQRIIRDADIRLEKIAGEIRKGNYPQEGLSFFAHMAGLFGQRLWFYGKTKGYSKKLKISDACTGCGLCAKNCPMGNLKVENGKAISLDKCAMCYRCISSCPKQAITLLGKVVVEQCRYEKFVQTENKRKAD